MYSRCEILFPHSRVSGLKKLKGEDWQKLTERIALLPETHEDALAFSHMMIKLCDCLNCDLSSYKAALGCSACSQRTINALRDTDQQLLRRFEKSKREVELYLDRLALQQKRPPEPTDPNAPTHYIVAFAADILHQMSAFC
jgi:hypothetical protein